MSGKILVTGGSGYIGGRLVQALGRTDAARLRIGIRTPRTSFAPPKGAEVVHLDMLDPASIAAACQGVSTIIHLAALNHGDCEADPARALMANTVGTQHLVTAARAVGVSRFVYLSTAHVYGAPLTGTLTEQSTPRPASSYAFTHRAAEDIVLAAHDRGAFTGIVLRLTNAVGSPADEGANAGMLLANDLCQQAVKQGKLTLRSSGLAVRDFVPMADVIHAIEHVSRLTHERVGDGLFNVSGRQARSVLDLAELVAASAETVLGTRPPIERPPPAPGETTPALDVRMDKLLATGFTPMGSLEDEIEALVRFGLERSATPA